MKYILLLCCFLMAPTFAEAQKTYYVAIIKGEVTYNGKRLKKRAKITTRGELRFGSPEAYIKVSGPGGIFTFRAHEKDTHGEFVTALSQELFPLVKARNSYAYSMGVENRISYLFSPSSPPFWEKVFSLPDSLLGRTGDVYLVADGRDGLLIRRAAKKNGKVRIRQAPFKGERPEKVSILLVNNQEEWDNRIMTADSVEHLGAIQRLHRAVPDSTKELKVPLTPEVVLMTSYWPGSMVDRKPFQRELRRQVEYIKPSSVDELLDDSSVQVLFKEMFGVSDFPSDAWNYVASLLKQ